MSYVEINLILIQLPRSISCRHYSP